jgi:sterol desaturase/sphingolipid hydroxylase (fatty acid hydroxylase superfamily)
LVSDFGLFVGFVGEQLLLAGQVFPAVKQCPDVLFRFETIAVVGHLWLWLELALCVLVNDRLDVCTSMLMHAEGFHWLISRERHLLTTVCYLKPLRSGRLHFREV